MPKLATWLREKDEKWFAPFFAKHPEIEIHDARKRDVSIADAGGLLLTGGPDIAPEFLRQPIPDPSILDKDVDPARDRWEFAAVDQALARGLPILAICKGMQLFNVALGGTLKLDIPGHKLPEQKDHDVQLLRSDVKAAHRFDKVNSSHHQAVDSLGQGVVVESWCANDDIIEQIRLQNYPFGLGVQYHPERGAIYDSLFEDFFSRLFENR
ncbi:MAG TPA: gamma-glutamyl-gamma-aminobutyrate hydrolase family protein [Chthoniobacterales bacterium]|jgi:putative glutamine amidotransferase|nr:gamma-glutamyl-gamma-aminobutyrate hydrolase family protein [Chthoniobacterales bacterium]